MPRDRYRAHDSAQDDDQFIILVKDIPRHCRWQELKDITRNYGGEHSLKAEVFELLDGSQMGHCTIKGRSAANQVYEQFCNHGWNGQCVCVSLAVLEKPGVLRTLQGPKISQGSLDAERPANGSLVGAPGVVHSVPTYTSHYTGPNGQPCSITCSPQYRMVNPSTGQAAMAHRPPLPYHAPALSAPAQAMPAYPSPSSSNKPGQFGTRTNPKSRTAASDLLCRPVNDGSTVSVSGLPSSQSETHLRGLLSRFGAVLYLEIHPDSHNPGKCKGTARARYQTSSEALNAVRGLDGATLANRKICVKQVKDDAVALASSGATRYESKRPVAATQVKKLSASMPAQPPRKHKPTRSPHHTRSKAQSSSAPPLVPSAEPASRNRGSTGSGSTSSAGPLVVNGATYSRRPSRDESSASDDSGEEDMDERDDKSSEEDDDENEGHAPVSRATGRKSRHRPEPRY